MPGNPTRVMHVPPGEGRSVWVVGDTYTFKATGAETDGRLTFWEATVPPNPGLRPTSTTGKTKPTTSWRGSWKSSTATGRSRPARVRSYTSPEARCTASKTLAVRPPGCSSYSLPPALKASSSRSANQPDPAKTRPRSGRRRWSAQSGRPHSTGSSYDCPKRRQLKSSEQNRPILGAGAYYYSARLLTGWEANRTPTERARLPPRE